MGLTDTPGFGGSGETIGRRFDGAGYSYRINWNGDRVVAAVISATRQAIDDVNEKAVEIAQAHPLWENQTYQTEISVFQKKAILEGPPIRVWGEWGIRSRPRAHQDDVDEHGLVDVENPRISNLRASGRFIERVTEREIERLNDMAGIESMLHDRVLTTKDVALFLEFGTIKMHARPWLYPAWDATKHMLGPAIAKRMAEISAGGGSHILRGAEGTALSHSMI